MGERLSHTAGIQEEVIRALLANSLAVMDIANQLDLTPREVRDILQETLLQFGDPLPMANNIIPIAAHIPAEIPKLGGNGLRTLLAKSHSSN